MNEKFVVVSKKKKKGKGIFVLLVAILWTKLLERENRMPNLLRYTRKTDPRAKVAFYQANNFSRFKFFCKLCFKFEKQND